MFANAAFVVFGALRAKFTIAFVFDDYFIHVELCKEKELVHEVFLFMCIFVFFCSMSFSV